MFYRPGIFISIQQSSPPWPGQTISLKNLTDNTPIERNDECPAQALLKALAGKWKPQIFRLALQGPVRFSTILREIAGANKQSISTALRELEEENLLVKNIISHKPLHIEYILSDRGQALIPVFRQLEVL